MNVIFNGNLIGDEGRLIDFENRAFQYGDGLFETMVYQHGELLFIEDHLKRLYKGMGVLKINIPDLLKVSPLKRNINLLLESNGFTETARIKLIVWRKTGGLFCPTSNDAAFLILSKDLKPVVYQERKVDFCNNIRLSKTIFSEFKTCSSVPYMIAGLEMKERGLDDIILLDNEGNVAECLYSNIFWVKNKIVFTPSLDTGCVSGIRRNYLLNKFKNSGAKIEIVKSKSEELLEADHVFSSNVAGIYPITLIKDKVYKPFFPSF